MIHHIVTVGLLVYAYYVNFTRIGIIIMLLHDISDIFLEAAKLSRYCRRQNLSFFLFVLFFVSWVACRCDPILSGVLIVKCDRLIIPCNEFFQIPAQDCLLSIRYYSVNAGGGSHGCTALSNQSYASLRHLQWALTCVTCSAHILVSI